MFRGSKLLVVGGAGFIGGSLAHRLAGLGAQVRATVYERKRAKPAARVEHVRCDLLEAEDCRRVCDDREYVFLCAAVTSGAVVMEKTSLVHLTPNLIMNARMLEAACAAAAKKSLLISSDAVYPVSDDPVRETDARNEFLEKYFIVGRG